MRDREHRVVGTVGVGSCGRGVPAAASPGSGVPVQTGSPKISVGPWLGLGVLVALLALGAPADLGLRGYL